VSESMACRASGLLAACETKGFDVTVMIELVPGQESTSPLSPPVFTLYARSRATPSPFAAVRGAGGHDGHLW
jgi:hypothetical protein